MSVCFVYSPFIFHYEFIETSNYSPGELFRQIWPRKSKSAELSIMNQISKNIKTTQEKMKKSKTSKALF